MLTKDRNSQGLIENMFLYTFIPFGFFLFVYLFFAPFGDFPKCRLLLGMQMQSPLGLTVTENDQLCCGF